MFANFVAAVKFIATTGFSSYIFGQFINRDKIKYLSFPFKPHKWELNGRIYEKFKISKWKDKLPDMSKISKKMFPKSIKTRLTAENTKRLILETCVAEYVHSFLILISPFILFFTEGFSGVLFMILNILGNVPFIMIQRYNRPRLIKVYDKLILKNNDSFVSEVANWIKYIKTFRRTKLTNLNIRI